MSKPKAVDSFDHMMAPKQFGYVFENPPKSSLWREKLPQTISEQPSFQQV